MAVFYLIAGGAGFCSTDYNMTIPASDWWYPSECCWIIPGTWED
jgi:hypothetical protein